MTGMVQVTQTDAIKLSQAIKDVLLRSSLSITHCRGQSYDRASNMSSRLSGVAVRIQQLNPNGFKTIRT